MVRSLVCTMAGAAILLHAGAATCETLVVRAVVLPRASLKFAPAQTALVITEHDVSRGYVDAPAASSLAIASTARRGVLLAFRVSNEHVRAVRLDGLGQPLLLGGTGGSALLPPGAGHRLDLQFRFYLDPETPAGSHPWPVQVEAAG